MMNFISLFPTMPGATDAPVDGASDKASEPKDDEFAGLLALMETAPVAAPAETELTGAGDCGLEEPDGEEPVQSSGLSPAIIGPPVFQAPPFDQFSDVKNDPVPMLYWGGSAKLAESFDSSSKAKFEEPLDSGSSAKTGETTVKPALETRAIETRAIETRAIETRAIETRAIETRTPETTAPEIISEEAVSYNLVEAIRQGVSLRRATEDARQAAPSPAPKKIPEPVVSTIQFNKGIEPVVLPRPLNESAQPSRFSHQPDESGGRFDLPYQPAYELPLASDVISRALKTATIISQAPVENESSSAAGLRVQDLLDKNAFFHFRQDSANDVTSSEGKEAKASPLETAFRDVVRQAAFDTQAQEHFTKGASPARLNDAPLAHDKSPREPDAAIHDGEKPIAARAGESVVDSASALRDAQGSNSSSPSAAIARQVISPMVEIANRLARRETRSLRIELHPEKFGQIELEITRGADGRLSAHLTADTNAARQALSEGLNHLRQSLEQSGLNVDRLDVRFAFSSKGQSQSRAQDDNDGRPVYSGNTSLFSSDESETIEAPQTKNTRLRLLSLRI